MPGWPVLTWFGWILDGRPRWMNVLMLFCGYMTFLYMPWDFFWKPVGNDEEVWFGILFHGWAAKLLELPHWAVYAAGWYGFRHRKAWMWPWASLYVAQIAFGMWIWNGVYGVGGFRGWLVGLIAFVAFGALALALWRARSYFHAPRPSVLERYGDWALVTGASGGLGAEFARQLARAGLSLVLTARREERLQELAEELRSDHGSMTRILVEDLADPEAPRRIAAAVEDLDIAILINNAGFGYQGRFDKLDDDRLAEMIAVNCTAPVLLTRRLLPRLVARGRGAVVITGSVSGRQPLPLHSVYSATKGFELLFGESIAAELREQGIDVLVLEPGVTDTEFQEVAGELAHPGDRPEEVVALALDALGRQPAIIPGWYNWARANVAMRFMPRVLTAHLAHRVMARQTPHSMR